MPRLTDHVAFKDEKLAARYATHRIPMATFYEAYSMVPSTLSATSTN